ncbi:MAG TPA: hypothetical protein VN841_18780 [Bryobacteraceae bacterium]|nr:hypothetical protein [Bryobacteraceae bacterium]
MKHVVLLSGMFVSVGLAQFVDLRAPGDGSELYYSLAVSRPGLGPYANTNPKSIYKIGGESTATLATGTPEAPWNPRGFLDFGYLTDYYQYSLPQFSADGSVYAYTGERDCLGRDVLCFMPLFQTTVIRAGQPAASFSGYGFLSANGRYLFTNSGELETPGTAVVDLQKGVSVPLFPFGAARDETGRIISNQGEVVEGVNPGLFGPPLPEGVIGASGQEPTMDANADRIVFVSQDRSSVQLLSRQAQVQSTLITGNGGFFAPAISADGQHVIFLSTVTFGTGLPAGQKQLYAINIDGTGFRDLTSVYEPAGVTNFAMSDDGLAAWYSSPSGAITKLDLHGEGIVRTTYHPAAVDLAAALVPGSATILYGANVPSSPDAVRIDIDGVPAQVLSLSSSSITFVSPDTLPLRPVQLTATFNPGSAPEAFSTATVSPFASRPMFLWLPICFPSGNGCFIDLGGSPIHQDWSALVSLDTTPASPGEIVHFYAMGLPPGASISCNLPVLYAGPAPGLPGFYQLDIQTPTTGYGFAANLYQVTLDCGPGMQSIYDVACQGQSCPGP